MIDVEKMASVLNALPDPAFILSRSGKYVAVFGGRNARYYHDGNGLVGLYIGDIVKPEKASWFIEQINKALVSKTLLVEEYELSNKDVHGLLDEGPAQPIWFEAHIQALDFLVNGEDIVLWVASNITRRHELELKLRELSDTDQLTKLFNRRKLECDLALHYEIFKRHLVPVSVLMFDLDHLKHVNDTLGHHAGDEVILTVSDICRAELRKTDIACRFGGDEFVIVLPNTDLKNAALFADRLHLRFNQALNHFSIDAIALTVSFGVTMMRPADRSHEDTLKRADSALYQAKRRGKNRVFSA